MKLIRINADSAINPDEVIMVVRNKTTLTSAVVMRNQAIVPSEFTFEETIAMVEANG